MQLVQSVDSGSRRVNENPSIKPLRLLILGGGAVVSEFYVPALVRLGWKTGITVSDISQANLERLKSAAPWLSVMQAGYESVLKNSAVVTAHDAVVVAVPNKLHFHAVLAALKVGLPVLCEKPLALNADDCEELSRVADQLRVPLKVGMVRRLTPALRAARAALDAGLVGQLQSVVIDHGAPYGWVSESGEFFRRENGGILTDLGVHHLDWLEDLLGPLEPVSYEDDSRGGVEASCRYELKNHDGIPVTLLLSYRHQKSNTTTLTGPLGQLVLARDNYASCHLVRADGLVADLCSETPFSYPSWPSDFTSCFAEQFHDFADTVWKDAEPAATASRAARTMALIEQAYSSRVLPLPDFKKRPNLTIGKTVVTGGSGFIGTALVERLVDCGFNDLVIPVRRYRTAASVARFPVELPLVDLNSRTDVREAVRGARWVFHLAYGQTAVDSHRVTVDGTKVVIEEAAAAGAEAVVVLSTMYVFGHPQTDKLVDESWAYAPAGGRYGKTKMQMEQWCLRRSNEFGNMRVVVLNPSCVFGPEGKTYTRLPGELAEKGEFAWVDDGQGIANYVYIDNLIDAMLVAASNQDAHGERFIVNDGSCTWREFLSPLLKDPAESFRSYSVQQLNAFADSRKTRLSEVRNSLLADKTLRNWVREQSWFQPFVEPTRRYLRRRPSIGTANGRDDHLIFPPSWLGDLFGPTSTRFSSAKLEKLGWKSQVDLRTAQERTVTWLTEMGFRK